MTPSPPAGASAASRLAFAILALAAIPAAAGATHALAAQAPAGPIATAAAPDPARLDSLVAERMLQEAAWEARALGDTALAARLLTELDSILRSTPVHGAPLSMDDQGVSFTFRVHFRDGVSALFKVDGSDPFCPECGADREVAAYRIDRLLGLDLTPMTVHTTFVDRGDTLRGSAMYWIRGARSPADEGLPKPDALRFLDAVLGNSDRHPGNWILTPWGRPVAIDHDRSFEYRPATRVWTCWETQIDSILEPAGLADLVDRFRALPADALAAAMDGARPEDARAFLEMRDRVVARMDARVADPVRVPELTDCPAP